MARPPRESTESMARPQANNGGAMAGHQDLRSSFTVIYCAPCPGSSMAGWCPDNPWVGRRVSMAGPQGFNDWQ